MYHKQRPNIIHSMMSVQSKAIGHFLPGSTLASTSISKLSCIQKEHEFVDKISSKSRRKSRTTIS